MTECDHDHLTAQSSACCRGWRKRRPKKIWEVRSVGLKAVGKAVHARSERRCGRRWHVVEASVR